MASFEHNLAAYNGVEAALGGAGVQPNDIVAVRAIAVLEGVSGGPTDVSDDNMVLRLNAIDVGAGGPGGHLNTLDALNSIVVLKGGVGGHENDLAAINEWVDFASGVSYLLRATFDAADQTFVDAQILDTEAEGVLIGQLRVVDLTIGVLQIISNQCDVTKPGTNAGLGFKSQSLARVLGRGHLVKFNAVDDARAGAFGWFNDDPTDLDFPAWEQAIGTSPTAKMRPFAGGGGQGNGFDPVFVVATDYELAFILGGYDVNGVPWRSGQVAASFLFGAAFYIKGGVFTTWTLLWRQTTTNLATVFVGFSAANFDGVIDDFRVPDVDLSAVLQPSNVSTFTASNGTSLDAIAPEVGGTWTEQSGNWDIQSNRANPDGAAIATVDTGEADAVVDCIVNGGTSDNPAIVLRFSDTSNLWYLQADRANNLLELHEVNATVDTVRASAAFTINDSTDYDLRAVAEGSTILGYIDFATEIKYTAATLNQTAEIHGIRAETTLGQFDNFAVFPRTSSTYDTEFDAV